LNVAAAFVAAGRAKDINEEIELANQSIDSRKTLRTLESPVEFSKAEGRFLRDQHELAME